MNRKHKVIDQKRESLIAQYEKWLGTKPRLSIAAAQCATIAEEYAASESEQKKEEEQKNHREKLLAFAKWEYEDENLDDINERLVDTFLAEEYAASESGQKKEQESVPVTGNLLKKYGFEYIHNHDYELTLPHDMGILLISEKWDRNAVLKQGNDAVSLMVVNYLHELKAVFFAITGNKLEIPHTASESGQKKEKEKTLKFRDLTIGELQDARNEYSAKITALAKEFHQRTGLRIETISQSFYAGDDDWFIEIPQVL